MHALAIALLLAAHPVSAGPPRWIEDDWPRAAAEASARGVPIFVEAWVPW